jgi:RNA polymerase sigma-70 factor (ECF subfamily)
MSEDHADPADADLLARAVDELAALEVLYRRYVRRVAAFAARRCSTADDVADAVAGTFDRLLRSAHRYDPARGTVASFVFAIAESEIADQRRRAARHAALVTRLQGRELLDADDIARAEAAIDAADAVAALEPALGALPDGEHEVLRLVADGLSPTEAAAGSRSRPTRPGSA